jgi:hypothetical protein
MVDGAASIREEARGLFDQALPDLGQPKIVAPLISVDCVEWLH